MNEDFLLLIKTALDSSGIKTDYNKLKQWFEQDPARVKTVLDVSATKTELNKFIKEFSPQLKEMFSGVGIDVNVKDIESALRNAFKTMQQEAKRTEKVLDDFYKKNINAIDYEIMKREQEAKSFSKMLQAQMQARVEEEKLSNSMDIIKIRAEGANKAFSAYLKTLKPEALKNYSSEIKNISDAFLKAQDTGDKIDYNKATASANRFKAAMKEAGMETASFTQVIKENLLAFTNWYAIGNVISSLVRDVKSAINTIKEVDTYLTEISKTSDITAENLKKLGIEAFDYASKYGVSVQAYLAGVQEMSRAGYNEDTAKGLAELSILAQAAGDMTAELANEYLIATNAAYKLNGDINKLNAILDSQNQVSNRNAITLSKLAEATKIVGSQAAASGIDIDELTAAITTMGVVTQSEGSVLGRAFKGILMNLQQVKGELDNGEIINEESFSKVEKAAKALGVELKEVRNGVLSLRNPMQVLKELAEVYSSLSEGDVRRANLLSSLGGKYRSNELNALLDNWKLFEKVLNDYKNASGSAAEEAQKTADSIEGRLNKLTNTWNRTVANVVDSDILKFFIDAGTNAVDFADKINLVQTALIGLGGVAIFKGGSSFLSWLKDTKDSIIGLGNALNAIKIADFKNDTTALSNALSGLTEKQIETVLSSKTLANALKGLNQEQIEQILINAQLPPALAKTTAATITNTVATQTATGATWSFNAALTGLLATIKANPIGFALGAITAIYSGVSYFVNKIKRDREEELAISKQVTEQYQNENKTLEEQIEKYKELRNQLDNSNLSTSEVKNIKDQLYNIQKDLIESYQLEAQGLDLVNGKYEEQIETLDKLTKSKAQEYLTKNLDIFNKAKKELEKIREYDVWAPKPFGVDKQLADFIRNYENEFVKLTEMTTTGGGRSVIEYGIKVEANAEEAEKILQKLYLDIKDFGERTGIDVTSVLENISKQSRNVWDDELKHYKETYDEYVMAMIRANDTLRPIYENAVKAVEEYNKAFATGEGIGKAVSHLQDVQLAIRANTHLVEGSEEIFNNLFSTLVSGSKQVAQELDDNLGKTLLRNILDISKESLDEYQKSLKKIQDALKSTDLSSSEITDLMQEFKDFDWKAYGITGEKGVGNLTAALNALAAQLQNDIIQAEGYNRAIEAMYEETVTASIGVKDLALVTDAANRKTKLTAEQVEYLKEKYIDLSKYLVKTKNGWYLEQEAISSVQTAIENLKKAYIDTQKEMTSIVESEAYKRLAAHGIIATAMESEYEFYQALASTPVNFAWEDVSLVQKIFDLQKQFKDIFSTPPEIKSGTSENEFSNSIDWASQSIQNLQKAVNKAQDGLKNTVGYDKQVKAVNKLIDAQKALKEGYENAAKSYKKQYDSITGISNYKKLIESGKVFTTSDFSDKDLYEKVKKAQDLWNSYLSSLENVRNTEKTIVDLNKKLLDDTIESDFNKLERDYNRGIISEKVYYEKRWDLAQKYYKNNEDYLEKWQDAIEEHYDYILKYQTKTTEAAISILENKRADIENSIAEREAKGNKPTDQQNQNLINVSKQLITQYEELIKKTKEEQKELKKGTQAWAELDSQIQEYQNTVSQLRQEISRIEFEDQKEKVSKWQDTIKKTVELFGRAIRDIKDDLEYIDEDSPEYFVKLNEASTVAANQANYLQGQIEKLHAEYKAGNINLEQYQEMLEYLYDALYDVNDVSKDIAKTMTSALSENQKRVLDDLADSYKKLTDSINANYEAYEKVNRAKKEALRLERENEKYLEEVKELTDEINKIQNKMTELQPAIDSDGGDRKAKAEYDKLLEELNKKQEDLKKKQRDREYDLQEDALDKALDDAKEVRDKQLEHAKTVYETKMDQLKKLYEEEKKLVASMTQYTSEQFNAVLSSFETRIANIIANINSLTGTNVSGIGSDFINKIKETQSNLPKPNTTVGSSGLTQAERERIYYILTHGEGKDYGKDASRLAAYTRDVYGSPISKPQMLEIAKILKVSGINSVDDITANDVNKDRILQALQLAGFKRGGLVKGTGEDGIALVKRDELIVNQAGTKVFTNELAPLMKNFVHDFNLFRSKLPDFSNITTKNSSVTLHFDSMIQFNGTVTGREAEVKIKSAGDELLKRLMYEINRH